MAPRSRRAKPSVLLVAVLALGTAGTTAKAAQLGDQIVVPEQAQAVDSVRWRDITSITPLSRRLLLIRSRQRPYLLTLKRACPGLRSDSIFVTEQENGDFEPATDLLRAAPPPNSGIGPIALNGQGEFSRKGLLEGTVRCRPDTLYAVADEDLEEVKTLLAEQSKRKKRERRKP